MSVELLGRPDTDVRSTSDGSHDRFTHIVLEGWELPDGEFIPETPVVDGMVFGTPVLALCGKVFIPEHNPEKHGVCPTCVEIAKEQGWTVPSS